ncbi:hypothetical protein BDN70DRAFT_931797 [Pholiota conissans]|uniref:DUF6818 domain-containing protein n=1 Tax=Pholiota conissans TaxID=109636 RepID=A0A9P6D1L7_9AGAR|nr:hypothetical protein BDN70DRAFT_931797 [Pholiota conissans]
MSPGNTPPRIPFNERPATMGVMGHGTPWKFSTHHSTSADRPTQQMGDYKPSFAGGPAQSGPFVFDSVHPFTSGAAGSTNAYGFSNMGSHPDPSQIPLPSTSDADLLHGPTIASSIGYASTSKVAGLRRTKNPAVEATATSNGKGKRKREDVEDSSGSESDDAHDEPPPKKTVHGGRRAGAGNYGNDELKQLLRLTEKELPVGQNGWKRIHEKYSAWAIKHGHSSRDAKSLEAKFKLMVKTKKPTGSGKRPETITRAKAIDKLINEKVGTRNLNDSEIDNDEEEGYTSDLDLDSKKHLVVARSDKNDIPSSRRTRGNQTADLALKLANSLDPEAQRLRDEDRANRSFQNTHIFMMSQQLRDANTTIETLRSELSMVRDHLHHVERARDKLDAKLNLERKMAALQARDRGVVPSSHKHNPDLTRVRGKIRHDEFFPEGGQMSTWITDGSSASDWDDNKENFSDIPLVHSPISSPIYKPQHMKYKLEQLSPKLPGPPASSTISSNSSFHATSTSGALDPFNAGASPHKPSFS